MSEPIVYIDRSRILPGTLEELRAAIPGLVRFIEEREPQLIQYGFYVDEAASRMTVIVVHPDPASVELHMDVGQEAFRSFSEFIELESIEVYGTASDRMLEQLKDKAAMLGDGGNVSVTGLHAGFTRGR